MSSPTPDWQALANRMERLERQNRRMKQAGAAILVLVAAVLLMGQAPATRTVEANEFILKDAEGRMRARLGVVMGIPGLTMFDDAGRMDVALIGQPAGPTLSFFNGPQKERAIIGIDSTDGFPKIILQDANEKPVAQLWETADGPMFMVRDSEGFVTTAGVTNLITERTGETRKTSAASVVLFDKDKKVLWQAP